MTRKQNYFGAKYWNGGEHNRKVEWINNIKKELEGLKKGHKAKIHFDSIRAILKKELDWKTRGHDSTHEYWFRKFTSIHDILVIEMK